VLHHRAGLLVELANAAVERGEVLLELGLAVFELLDDGSSGGFDGGGETDVGLVGDPTDAEVHLVVAALGLRGELGETLLDRRQQRLDRLLALGPSGALGCEFAPEALHLGGDLLAEPFSSCWTAATMLERVVSA
jgi:hypothetical protein